MTKQQARSRLADRPRRWLQGNRPSGPIGRSNARLLCGASLAAMVLIGLPSAAYAQEDRNWDPNGTAANRGGTGTWDISSPSWSPNGDGVSGPYTPWNNGSLNTAIFGGPNGTVATVTLITPITVRNLTFDTGTNYSLTGNTLALAGATPTITTNGTATVNSILAGSAGLTKAGAGALTLTGANTFSGGINVTAGTLSVSGDSALGAASNTINLSSGAALRSTGALANSRTVTLLAGTSYIGGGVGSAHITGAGGFSLTDHTGLSDDTNDFAGPVSANGFNLYFTSIRNLGEASALGAATTAANGAVYVRNAAAIYTGSGDTSNRSWSMAPFTGSSALRNQGTGTLTVTGDIGAGGGYTASVILGADTADLELLGVISSNLATRPFIFTGGGTNRSITLGDVNTFGGSATIQTVTVKAGSLTNQGVASSLGTGGSIYLNTGVLSYTGSGGSTDRALLINGSSSLLNDGTGALALSGAAAFYAPAPADTLTLGGSFAGNNTVSGIISGNGNLVMNGAAGSRWLLSGANTYIGTTTVTSGTLQAGSDQAFGAPNAVIVNGGTLDLNTHDIMVTSLAGTGGSVALNGAELTVNGTASTSYAGSITGTGNLVKRGTGMLTLSGQSTYTGNTTINGGTLALNFGAAGAPASDILSSTSTLNMAGGALALTGGAGLVNSQTLAGLNVTAGNNRVVATSGAGGSMTLNLGALTRTGGLIDFALPTSGSITTTSSDGALGWATVNGTDYAQIQAGTITAFTAYANKDDASTWLAGDVVSDAGGAANSPYTNIVSGNVQLGGLKYTAAANSTVTVGGANTLGVDGTIIVASSVGNASQTITGGTLTGSAGGGTVGIRHNGTGTGTFTLASTIADNAGATGFIKGGTGRVALTGANSYTGGTTISGGTLAISSVANAGVASSIGASSADSANLVIESGTLEYTGAGAEATDRGFTLVNGGPSRTIQVTNGGANLIVGGVVVGPDDAGLIKTGAGTLTLANAANSYTGLTTVSGGTLSVNTLGNGGAASGIGASTSDSANLVLQNAGGLQYSGATTSTDRGFTLGTGNGRIDVIDPAALLTVSGVATGAGGLVKEGAGTLVLSGTNLYQGGTTISAGTLRAGSIQAFGNQNALMDVATGATLDLGGFANKVGALAGSGNVVLGSATLTTGGANGTFAGTISGSGGFTRAAGGTQTILGCNNNYTGATSVVGGALSVDCLANGGLASGIGASSNASANLVLNNSSLIYTGGSTNIDRGLTAIVTGAINVANAATELGIGGVIAGSGALRKDGAGTLVLTGNNSYTGVTSVTGGILRAGSNNAIGHGGLGLNNTAGVLLDLNNFNTAIGYLNGGGAAGGNITLGTATLTIAGNAASGNYAGAISGSGGLIKGGTFTQALTGCASSYTGSTVINGGALQVACLTDGGSNSAIGAASNAASNLVLNGGTLSYIGAAGSTDRLFTLGGSAGSRLDASGSGAIAFTNTGAITFSTPGTNQTIALGGTNGGNNSLAAQLTNNGAGVTSLTKDGAGTWILNNPNSNYTGITTINGGVLGVDKLSNGGLASSIGASSAAAANLVIGNNSTLRYTGAGDTTNRLFTLSAGTTFLESSGTGAIVFTDTGLVTLAGADQARTIALGGTNSGNNTLAGSIGNAGTGITVLAKNDAGTWLLTGNNSYTGNTNINAGTLILGNGGTTGSIASTTVNNLGVLGFNRSDTTAFGGVIGGTGSVRQLGTGTTALTGNNIYTGGTTISAGTLQLGNGGTTGSILGDVANNGVLAFNRSDVATFGGVISGSGSVRQSGAGTTILTGINSYAGGTTISAGTLQISSDANLGAAAGPLSFNNGILRTTADITSARNAMLAGAGTVLTDGGTSFTLGGAVSGAGGLTKSGAGTLILTGANNYAGGTTISGGTLSLGNGGTTGSILGDVTNNGTLVFDRSDNIGFGGLVSGSGSITQRGAGVVTLTANNSYSGTTNVNAGRLLINGNQSAATGLTSVASGAALGGSGVIGGNVNVANGGLLAPGNSPGTMTINGNLSLASGSILDFEFGQADVVGGPLNDLVNVGGNLVLDGTLNVGVSAGGAFGGGIYRVFNYGGTLTDNGLTLGVLPVGSSVTVQTSVAGQVNLINSVGLSLSFWDGNAGPKFNNVINGGNGTWHLGGADNNWTNGDGSVNAAYDDGTLAIFAGAAGTVTVDNTGGAVTASGLQFASNGYLINGGPLTLTGPDSMVRVGDGTAAGAGYTATIAAVLAGTTRLVKTDLGTLVLTGANSYTGGTAINGGTLRIGSDANLGAAGSGLDFNGGTLNTTTTMTTARAVTLSGAGTFTNTGTILRLAGAVTGGGRLIKNGTGTLALAGDATHSGGTTIAGGTLQIGIGGTAGSIVGDILNNGTLEFQRSDAFAYGGSISGTGALAQSGAGTLTLTGNSNYSGATNITGGGVHITSGAVVSSGSAFVSGGTLSVDGPTSVFNVGGITAQSNAGVAGVVNVQNGGVLRTSGNVTLRNSPLNIVLTTLNVSGAGSLADIGGAVTVGISGAPNVAGVNVSAGGKLKTGAASQMGAAAGNTTAPFVTITGAGSNWTSSSTLAMTNGTFSLLNGGTASFTTATIGSVSAARPANMLVSGTDSRFSTTGNLTVGTGVGTGVVTLADGGLLSVGGSLLLADNAGATGVLNIGGGESLPAAAAGTLNTASVSLGSATSRVNFNHIDPAYSFTTLLSGIGNVNQVAGTTILAGNNSYTGATNVSGGTLIINGDQTGATGLTTVAAAATLGGIGTVGGNVTVTGGTINPGDIGTAPGALTINGNLNIASGSNLNVNFGQANVVGGALNDLVNVGGDLVLDGTLNVQTSPGGSFDPGLYRIINYAGALTDNGLTIGTIPSPDFYVQTSIANQVNLVNTSGLQFRYWDGTGAKNDGIVDGGDGVWQRFTGNDNWVDDGSIPNAPFADSAFAVFMGAAGTVAVDESLGAVNVAGMQFLTDGYAIEGDALTLTGSQATIRVGDGTVAGAGMTATIAGELAGTAQLLKSDLGTLILTGANSYSGGTAINAGILQVSGDANLGDAAGALIFNGGTLRTTTAFDSARAVDLSGNGTLLVDAGITFGLTGVVSSAGNLTKAGTGTLILGGDNDYTGTTAVDAGTLFVNGNQAAATGFTSIALGATLGGTGVIGGDVTIADGATLVAGSAGVGTLTINGDLGLSTGSVLDFEFGQANIAGGALNDLVNVGGDLTLDGTINVSVPSSGNFGPGIYRVFNYGGALTDNGLALGAMPGGGQVSVQTAIAGQVNLVNSAGLMLSFWDGNVGPKNNGAVNGGDGVWRIGGGLNNWTDVAGALNADYAQDSFAIFSAAPATVTIDNSGGTVLASGMQFASDGYTIIGDALTLTGGQAIVQVGDSSAAGAGYTATIASELAGTAGLVKTDLGALILTGPNSYAGGTTVDGGTLQIGNGGATGRIIGDIANNGALVVNRSGTIALGGTISGTGSLTKRGSGLLELTGTNSYAGGTLIDSGTVRVSNDAGLGDATGTLSLQGGTLQASASFASTRGILLGGADSNAIDTQGFNVTLSGVIGDLPDNMRGNFLDKLGTGTLTLTGANNYSNRTTIAGGTLALAGNGTIGAGNLIVGSGSVFDISQTATGASVIQLNGAADGTVALGSKTLTLGFFNSFTDWTGSITDGGIGGGTGGNVIIAAPIGTVRYSGATSYTGGTTVASGRFELAGNGSLYSQGAVAVSSGATFDISGLAAAGTTIGDLSGAGAVSLGGKALTFGTANDTAFSGPITGNGGGLIKQGTGTFTLSGANSYTGATDVLSGTLLVNGNQSAATGLTSVASGATLGGFGILGGDVTIADGATLAPGAGGPGALTVNGNLALAAGSTLGFEFGQANNPGGPLNDVVNVGGNLLLDGTLDVAISPGGAFDIGLYRIAKYGGTLTDNGLILGTMPAGANVQVQTAIAGEVNLISRGSATLNFWDGAAGPKFDGAVNGGDGIWQNGLGNDNWADISGAVNAGYDNGAFAIFSGATGTVTIDNSLGAVSATGLQFAADGYRITGQALTLTGPQAVVRVGDGTIAGQNYVATIDAEVTGATQLVKTDAGTLLLEGTNSYTGGTLINGGTIRIASDANLGAAAGDLGFGGGTLQTTASFASARDVGLAGSGTFLTDAGTTLLLTGSIDGAGGLVKSGAGTLTLGGNGTYSGGTTVGAGVLLVNGDYSGATGATNVSAGAALGGTGTIGGDVVFASGATLAPGAGAPGTLTVNGSLSLAAGTQLDFEFGEANAAGGTLNDLVNVGGNLTLDGTINVGVPTGGAFDVGIYRVFNYGGSLTDNGLSLGTMPAGGNVAVQTSVAGQVNLVNSAGLTLNFWDGAAGPKNNGTINGGNGVWQAGTGNDSWTDASGAVNAPYSDGAFAIFGGTGGTVTVDNALGTVSASGMQFAANGYVITGGAVTLGGSEATIRVGDGSTAGTGFTATINSVLAGAAELVKTDAGTLVLGGANSYTGGTLINGGTVQIASDANLGAATGGVTLNGGTLATTANLASARGIDVVGLGTISTAAGTTFTFNGLFAGSGELTKAGAGTLSILGDNGGFAGSTRVAAGTLAVQGSLGGAVNVGSAGRLEGAGRVGGLVNAGVVAPGSSIGTLTVAGDYSGNGGVLEIEAELGGDTSAADRLVVSGATSGNTAVTVANRGGLGAQTVEGIKIVDVVGASNGNFALDGDYLFDGQQAVIAGAYGYRLFKNGVTTPQDGDWYLRSARLDGTGNPQGPLYQPGVPVYEAYVGALQSLNRLPTLQQRVGNRSWAASPIAGAGLWGRFESERQRPDALVSTSGADRKLDQWQAQLGLDATLTQRSDGAALVGGLTAHYGKADSAVTSIFGNGTIGTQGYGVGATMTWYGPQGFYVDGQVKLSWFDSDLESNILGSLAEGNKGDGQAFSLELGKQTQLGRNLSITPQVQMSYAKVDFDRFADPADASISAAQGESLKTRWGLAIDHQTSWKGRAGDTRRTRLYSVINLSYEWLDGAVADVSGTPVVNRDHRLSGELGLGGSYSWGDDRFTLYTEVSGDTAIADFGAGYNLKGTAGVRVRF